MQTIGDRIWFRIHAFVLEKIAERLNEVGFTGGYLDAAHVSGGASSGLSHTATGHTAATLGNLLYAAAAGVWSLLAGNTTSTRKFLRQTGTGAVSAAPAWDTLVDGDLPTTLAGKTLTTATLTAEAHDSYSQYDEIADPASPASNKARLYVRDNGSGKTQLVVLFPTGVVQILATEP